MKPGGDRGRWRPARHGRTTCPWCGRTVALVAAGTLRAHGGAGGRGPMSCAGVGEPPRTAVLVEGEWLPVVTR